MKRMKPALVMSIVCVLTATVAAGQRQATAQPARSAPGSRIHKIEELTWRQIDALNRQRTLFILPVGMLEQHGPHLPVGADTIGVMYEANRVSTRVSRALPDWNVVMMPAVNYGHGGANLLGDRPIHPGTYAIRQSTLRSFVADLGAQIAQNGFKWIFVMNGHGAPTHNIAINEACDFVSESYAVTMLHRHRSVSGRCCDSIERRADQRPVLFRRRSLLLRHGCPCRRQRNIRDPRHPARFGPCPITSRSPARRGVSGRVAKDRDRTRLAGLSVVPCQGDGGAWPGGRGMVDRRIHGSDPARRARGEHVRACASARDGACGRGPDLEKATGERSRIRTPGSRTGWRNARSARSGPNRPART